MDRAEDAALRQRGTGAAARRRDDPVEAGVNHPIFDSVQALAGKVEGFFLESSEPLAEESKTSQRKAGNPSASFRPRASDPYYEVHLYETGRVQTRPDNKHDLFNALAWLAFPKTKARINAMHAAEIPRKAASAGGCATCSPSSTKAARSWFATGRSRGWCAKRAGASCSSSAIAISASSCVGHAVLEQALDPHPGITCKVIFADPSRDLDTQAARWLATTGTTPRDLPPLPVFGYPAGFRAAAGRFLLGRKVLSSAAAHQRTSAFLIKCPRESARQPLHRKGQRKVRAPESGMRANGPARIRAAQAAPRRRTGPQRRVPGPNTRKGARPGVKRGNLHPEQHQIGRRVPTHPGRLDRSLRVGGLSP